jgi:uncharacterized protein
VRVLISGSNGFIGSRVVQTLRDAGHEVVRLVRSEPGPGAVKWDPAAGTIDIEGLGAIEGAVHLAGEGIGDRRWSVAHKSRVLDSRVRGTRLLAETLASLEPLPEVLISASAVGYYGDRGTETLTEDSGPGSGWLAEVVQQWEASSSPAREAGIRVVNTRSGLVLSPAGGALKRLLIPFRLGLGGRLGPGDQYWPWIALEDEVGAIVHLLENPSASGPYNLTAPYPVTNAEFVAALGRALSRPAVIPVPALALKIALSSQMVEEMLLYSQRIVPTRLQSSGFRFAHEQIEDALKSMLR